MAWRGIGELAGDVMQRVKTAAAEQGNAATALAPAARRGNCGDELLREECDSPSPMRASGGVSAQSELKRPGKRRLSPAKEPSPRRKDEPAPRPVMLRCVEASMGRPRAIRRPGTAPSRALGRPMLVLVWDADRHAAASLQR